MRLGEMLIRDGRLSDSQLKQALAIQARNGGRLGTVLFEHGLIDLDALTVYLGLELGIPIATGAMLERAKRAAVRLLQPAQAFQYKAVPLVVQERQLIAAIEDPQDVAALEALTQQTGYQILPRIAPELRIYYYVERYYGVARPARFLKFGEVPRGDENASDSALPAPPLPGLPPVPTAPVTAPGPRPRLRSAKAPRSIDESGSLELDAEDLIESLEADEAEPAPPVRPQRLTSQPKNSPVGPPLSAESALTELAAVTDRDHMIDVLLAYSSGVFEIAVLFAVRDQLAFGWRAVGNTPGCAFVEHLLIPLDAPTILATAIANESGIAHAAASPSTVSTYLYKVLGTGEPKFTTACAILIGKRVVSVLYGQGNELTPLQLEDLRQVCAMAAEAYARLIIAVRQRSSTAS